MNFDKTTMSQFNILAIMACYNEGHIISYSIRELLNQELDVYFIDDGSTDETKRIIHSLQLEFSHGRIFYDYLPQIKGPKIYDWTRILKYKEQVWKRKVHEKYNWILHVDGDEFFHHPFNQSISLRKAIEKISLETKANTIGVQIWNFYPDEDYNSEDPRKITMCSKSKHPPRNIVRFFERSLDFVIHPSGGHKVASTNPKAIQPKLSPHHFLLRHYPITSAEHYVRKVLNERLAIYAASDKRKGWHSHYSKSLTSYKEFLASKGKLIDFFEEKILINYIYGSN